MIADKYGSKSIAAYLHISGFIRCQGLIGGKWSDAYDWKTIKVQYLWKRSALAPIILLWNNYPFSYGRLATLLLTRLYKCTMHGWEGNKWCNCFCICLWVYYDLFDSYFVFPFYNLFLFLRFIFGSYYYTFFLVTEIWFSRSSYFQRVHCQKNLNNFWKISLFVSLYGALLYIYTIL